MYKLIRPLLFSQDSEQIHDQTRRFGKMLANTPFMGIVEAMHQYEHPSLETSAFGLSFKNPVGLAAGFDKNAELVDFMPALGFGFVEVGTITPRPQEGNPKPRLFRLPEDEAIINRMGFNNEGVEAQAARLSKRTSTLVLGGNIGKNKTTEDKDTIADYEMCFNAIFDYVDYFTVNVSSPNTPNLRALQDKEPLTALLTHVMSLNRARPKQKPVLLKIAPDLNEHQLNDIIEVVLATKIDGVIATNTTITRDGLHTSPARIEHIGMGGLSGRPVRTMSTNVIRYLYTKSGGAFPIIGVGGISSAEDAYEKIRAGASLVQVYTGLIYEGPGLVKKIKKGLVELLLRDGFSSVQEAVGTKK